MKGSGEAPRSSGSKRLIITLLQVAFTAGVLYLLVRDPDKRAEMMDLLRRANRGWLTAGLVTYGVVELLAAWRWERLLHVQGIFLGRLRLMTLLLIGLFFNFFIPGGTGGDVVKVFYLIKEAPGRKTAAVLSVLIDRIVGLFSLIIMALCFIATRWAWLTATEETRSCVISGLVILGLAGGFVIFASILSGFGLAHRLPPRFPARQRLTEVALALNQYGRSYRDVSAAMVCSLLCHLAYIFTFYCAAQSLAAPGLRLPSYLDLCAIMPLVNSITSLPISIGGMGLREGLFQIFLHQLADVHEAVAVVISSAGFLLTAVWGVFGGLVYLFYRPSEHARVTRITEEVAALEHDVAEEEIALETAAEKE